jgi:hypothetical protein
MRLASPRLVALSVVAIAIGAGIGGTLFWLSFHRAPTPSTGRWADGPTLYQALEQVNTTVRNTTGGPWELFSYIGFAPEGPFSPAAFGYSTSDNLTLKACQSQFDGLTLWNGTSFPIFNGSIASGTATFWQFAFLSNVSQEIIVATNVLGIPHMFPPLALTNSCMTESGMAVEAPGYLSWVNPLPVDTSLQASKAYNVVGKFYEVTHSPLVEVFANGWPPLSEINHGEGGGAAYLRCGLVGAAGLQPKGFVGEWPNGSVQNTFNGSLSCTGVASLGPPVVYVPYYVAMAASGVVVPIGGGSRGLSFPIQIEFQSSPTNSTPVYFDGWGLTSWMTELSVRNATGQDLPSTPLSCQNWVPALASCQPTGVGWSAILLSASGSWMDSFPSLTNHSDWAIPNVPLIGGEQLVVTYPTLWNVSTDQFEVNGTSSIPVVSGSVPI